MDRTLFSRLPPPRAGPTVLRTSLPSQPTTHRPHCSTSNPHVVHSEAGTSRETPSLPTPSPCPPTDVHPSSSWQAIPLCNNNPNRHPTQTRPVANCLPRNRDRPPNPTPALALLPYDSLRSQVRSTWNTPHISCSLGLKRSRRLTHPFPPADQNPNPPTSCLQTPTTPNRSSVPSPRTVPRGTPSRAEPVHRTLPSLPNHPSST